MSVIDFAKEYINQPQRLSITPDPELNAGRGFSSDLILPLTIDTLFSADIPEQSDITQVPIERRSNVTDHVTPKPIRIEIDAGYTPFNNLFEQALAGNAVAFLSGGVQNALGPIAGKASTFGLAQLQNDLLKAATPWERFLKLKKLKDNVVLVTVSIVGQEYKSLVISELSPKIDRQNGDSVRFKAVFQQISFVSLKTERVKLKKGDNLRKSATQQGVKPSTPADPSGTDKLNKSALKNVIGFGKSLFGGGSGS